MARRLLRRTVLAVFVAGVVLLAGCGGSSDDEPGSTDAATIVELPGASAPIDFDDIAYAPELERMVVPAADSGLYLIDPRSAAAKPVPGVRSADSADFGGGWLYVLDRGAGSLEVVDADRGGVVASARPAAPGDYVRYVAATREVWVTEPSRERIEIFTRSGHGGQRIRSDGFIAVPNGVEGLTVAARGGRAYTLTLDGAIAAIDVGGRSVADIWPDGCDGSHGFPALDERAGLVLGGCTADGEVSLLDSGDGRRLAGESVGGGEALQAFAPATGHFYVRSDPGGVLATLDPAGEGLDVVSEVNVPESGHCLGTDDLGHYWTCDAAAGRILRFSDRG